LFDPKPEAQAGVADGKSLPLPTCAFGCGLNDFFPTALSLGYALIEAKEFGKASRFSSRCFCIAEMAACSSRHCNESMISTREANPSSKSAWRSGPP
jgi:hypothetical protein